MDECYDKAKALAMDFGRACDSIPGEEFIRSVEDMMHSGLLSRDSNLRDLLSVFAEIQECTIQDVIRTERNALLAFLPIEHAGGVNDFFTDKKEASVVWDPAHRVWVP